MKSTTIALLSQPNAGKSTLFNGLTGSKQHVGNWPGKTVEKKEGHFVYNGQAYKVIDLPGSYSLSANSDEEMVTRDYIASEEADLICILADASQLERSLYMLADYCGINKPVFLVLNMMDVANEQGKKVDVEAIANKLGIYVVGMCASNTKNYDEFFATLQKAVLNPKILTHQGLTNVYHEKIGTPFEKLMDILPEEGIDCYSPCWLTTKLIEGDTPAIEMINSLLEEKERKQADTIVSEIDKGNLLTSSCKFQWIEDLMKGIVQKQKKKKNFSLKKFDQIATSRIWGKPLAITVIILGLLLSFVPAAPFMALGMGLPGLIGEPIANGLLALHASNLLVSLIADAIISAVGFCVAMVGFVLGVSFVFGLLEEIGYMARISYVFDNTMSKMGLQGKSMMPLLLSFGCNMGGVAGSRVIDTWGQKTLTIAMAWALPCAGSWGVVALLTGTFFGASAPIIIISFFVVAIFHIWLTSKLFRKSLIPDKSNAGLIMELPPYHKPKWGNLFRFVFGRFIHVFWKAIKIVSVVCIIIWALSYSPTGNVSGTILYRIGTAIEPVTMFFGLKWQLFIAWICSAMGKEATLGVLSALFGAGGSSIFISEAMNTVVGSNLGNLMLQAITKPEALAFLFAFMFNIPCFITLGATQQEIHSWKWTTKIALYYIVSALVYAFIAYRIGLLIW